MASVIAKWQKCGKSNCRCSDGFLHGPYLWLVSYISKRSTDSNNSKYLWRYLGKNPKDVWEKLELWDKRFREKYNIIDLNRKITRLKQKREETASLKTIEQIFKIEEVVTDR